MSRIDPPAGAGDPPPYLLPPALQLDDAYTAFRTAVERHACEHLEEFDCLTAAIPPLPAFMPAHRQDRSAYLDALAGWLTTVGRIVRAYDLAGELRLATPPEAVSTRSKPEGDTVAREAAHLLLRLATDRHPPTAVRAVLGQRMHDRHADALYRLVGALSRFSTEVLPDLIRRRRACEDAWRFTSAMDRLGLTVEDVEGWLAGRKGEPHGLSSRPVADLVVGWLSCLLPPAYWEHQVGSGGGQAEDSDPFGLLEYLPDAQPPGQNEPPEQSGANTAPNNTPESDRTTPTGGDQPGNRNWQEPEGEAEMSEASGGSEQRKTDADSDPGTEPQASTAENNPPPAPPDSQTDPAATPVFLSLPFGGLSYRKFDPKDYRVHTKSGTEHRMNLMCFRVVEYMAKAMAGGRESVPHQELMDKVTDGKEVRGVFKDRKAWGTLVVHPGPGRHDYKLNPE